MASGYGRNGGVSRCFPFWQDLLACYVMNTNEDSDKGKVNCMAARDDYVECLFHAKEIRKTRAIQYRLAAIEAGFGEVRDEAELKSLGLLANREGATAKK